MGDQVYYRGETSNHQGAKPGQYQMDYGDGLYLISDKSTADAYAQKRVNEKGGVMVITQVTIKPGQLGRVLDLTTDVRWTKFINTPMVPGKDQTMPRMLMRIQQNNFTIFKQFLSQNKINIAEYDAVKGAELTHGGTQVAILNKNGVASPIATSIRGRLTPVVAEPIAGSGPKAPAGSRIGSGLRSVGGSLIMVALSILASWLRAKADQIWMEKGLAAIEPLIWSALIKRVAQIADVMAKGKKAYANVIIDVSRRQEAAYGDFIDAIPRVTLIHVDVSDANLNAEGVLRNGGPLYEERIRPYQFSFEITIGPETIKVWKDFIDEWNWYEDQMKKTPSLALDAQRQHLRQEILQVFGQEADMVLMAWMWPKFKFKGKPV